MIRRLAILGAGCHPHWNDCVRDPGVAHDYSRGRAPERGQLASERVARGAVLAAEAHCMSCHTRPGGDPFAGGYGVNTPFGGDLREHITPDPNTGIGRWSLAAFTRAMHEGVSRDGAHLFAAFPYNAYTGSATTTSRHCMPT